MATALLSINHATIRSFNSILFSNLNFRLQKGEHWALIGESGSGKSILLQTIAGNIGVSNGSIVYHFFDEYLLTHPEQAGHLTHHKLIALVEPKHHFKNLSNTADFYYQQRYNSSDSEDALTVEKYLETMATSQVIKNGNWDLVKVLQTLKLEHLHDKQLIKLSNGETPDAGGSLVKKSGAFVAG